MQLPAGLGVQRCSEQNCFGPLIPGKRGSLLPDLRVEVTSASTVESSGIGGLELDWNPQPCAAPMGFVSEPCGLVRFSGPPWGLLLGAGGTEGCPPMGHFFVVAPRLPSAWGLPEGLTGPHILGSRTLFLSHPGQGDQGPWSPSHSLSPPPQTLESSVLRAGREKGLSEQDPAQDSQLACLPARIREIITRNLSQPENQGAALHSPPQTLPAPHPFSHPPLPWL